MILSYPQVAKMMVESGLRRAEDFSLETCARETLALFERSWRQRRRRSSATTEDGSSHFDAGLLFGGFPQRKPASYYGKSALDRRRQGQSPAVGSPLARLALDAALADAYKFLVLARAQTRPDAEVSVRLAPSVRLCGHQDLAGDDRLRRHASLRDGPAQRTEDKGE